MRDFASQRDEDERVPVMMATTPASSRTPTSRRTSFSILSSANSNAASATAASQGSFVAPFSMARDEQVASLELARSQLPVLVSECSRSEKATAAQIAESGPGGPKWKRIKSKKKSDVQVWEKGGASDSSGGSRKKTSGTTNDNNSNSSNSANPSTAAHYTTTTTSTGRDIFADPDAFNSPLATTYAVRSAVRVKAPLDVVLKTLDCSAVTAYRSFTKIIYESLVADTSVLYHSQSPTASSALTPMGSSSSHPNPNASCCSPSESLAVRWMVCRCNNPMVSDCDFCMLEYSKVTSVDDPMPRRNDGKPLFKFQSNNNNDQNQRDSPGRSPRVDHGLHDRSEFPSAYKILSSMETKSCPELLDSHRLARCFVPLGGFLFYPTDNADVTDVVFYMSVTQDRFSNQLHHANGSSNPFSTASSNERQFRAIQRVLQHMARGVGRVKNAVDAYTMSLRLEMLRNTRWVRNTERAECVVCYRRFHQLTRRRHHCRLCGDVICRDCSVYKDADLPTIGPTILRICTLCDLNELKASAGSAAATAAANTATLVTTGKSKGSRSNNNSNNNPEEPSEEDLEEKGEVTQLVGKKLTRKRSTTLNVDTTKGIVHDQDQEPQVGRRFTTVVDGKQRRELPHQAFSCSKADIAQRQYKWNTGGGGKPLVILSPHSAALYASKTGKKTSTGFSSGGGLPGATAKAMTPTGRQKTVAPQDLNTGAQTFSNQQHQHQFQHAQAKSCSKLSSTEDPFSAFTFRGKASAPGPTAKGAVRRTPDPENDRELDGIGEESDDEDKFFPRSRGGASVHPNADRLHGAASVHPTRVVKSGKLVVPGHEHEVSDDKKKKKTKKQASNNQQHELNSNDRLLPRKLMNVEQYEDILLTLCEQVSRALDCKYAALSLFTGSSPNQSPATSVFPLGQPATPPHVTAAATPLSPSTTTLPPPGATGSYENLPAVHFLKAIGGKKLAKVAANLMCCAPILELKDKLITRDALGNCNMFDFKTLPIVIGPQQVRFYAGIPLVDGNHQMVGAFAVFDSNMYQGRSLNEVLPTMEAFAAVALTAIEDRKTELELKSFLKNPLVDTKGDNQAIRLSEPVFHIDMDLNGLDDEFPATYHSGEELQIRSRFSSRPPPPHRLPPAAARGVEYYKSQMEQLVRQAQETEAQMLENSMAMKRQGVAIW